MIAAGIGCKRGAPASDIEAAIRAAADSHDTGGDWTKSLAALLRSSS